MTFVSTVQNPSWPGPAGQATQARILGIKILGEKKASKKLVWLAIFVQKKKSISDLCALFEILNYFLNLCLVH